MRRATARRRPRRAGAIALRAHAAFPARPSRSRVGPVEPRRHRRAAARSEEHGAAVVAAFLGLGERAFEEIRNRGVRKLGLAAGLQVRVRYPRRSASETPQRQGGLADAGLALEQQRRRQQVSVGEKCRDLLELAVLAMRPGAGTWPWHSTAGYKTKGQPCATWPSPLRSDLNWLRKEAPMAKRLLLPPVTPLGGECPGWRALLRVPGLRQIPWDPVRTGLPILWFWDSVGATAQYVPVWSQIRLSVTHYVRAAAPPASARC